MDRVAQRLRRQWRADDDPGEHTIWIDQEFRRHFSLNFWHTTLFSCYMKWDSQDNKLLLGQEDKPMHSNCSTFFFCFKQKNPGIFH